NLDAARAIHVGQRCPASALDGQVLLRDHVVRQQDCPADGGTKLAYVSRPVIRQQQIHRRLGKTPNFFLQFQISEVQEALGQVQDIFAPISQRRNLEGEFVQPKIHVAAQRTLLAFD